jgi:DNA-binding NtrC family response regulator
MIKVLVIDDEREMLDSLKKLLSRRSDFELKLFEDPEPAFDLLENENFDIVITDLKMKEISGQDVLAKVMETNPDTKVIMISGYGTIEASVQAVKKGAFDFIEKPFTSAKLFESINRALKQIGADDDEDNDEEESFQQELGLIYKSNQMKELVDYIKKVAEQDMNILITGESGTGKELIARAIHSISKGSSNPFVPVNCGALPEHLFESELFGHVKGAFTGAVSTKPGLLEFANNGTFFLDEIGDLTPALQIKLLRMLEERKIRRVGGHEEININVRIIAATNRDLEEDVRDKRFREDLYYRLNIIRVDVPPLRDRPEDIIHLAKNYLEKLCNSQNKSQVTFTPDAKETLLNYHWPGNVRELQNIIGRTYLTCSDNLIKKSDLPLPQQRNNDCGQEHLYKYSFREAKEHLTEEFELKYLTYHLKKNDGNISKTAQSCGMDRRTVHRLINKHNIIYKDNS